MSRTGQGVELQPVVDEVEEEARETSAAKENQNKGIDWDKVCAYKTFKVVRIRDAQLGLCYWSITTCVILYVVVFCFSIEGKHQLQEPGVGTVLTKIFGKAYSGEKVFDPSDLRFPVIEPSGAFLLTRRVRLTQKRGQCVDWDSPKRAEAGVCDEGETVEGDYCKVSGWCPSLGDKNADKPPPEAVVEELEGLDKVVMKILSGIAFPGLGNRFFVTGGTPGATNQFKNITVKQVLALSDPPQKLDKKLINSGALIGVSFFWSCAVDEGDCEPQVVIKRLDSGQGFVQKRARYYREGTVDTREALYMNGLRILVDSSGIGKKASLVLAIIQVGSAIALVRVAAIVSDNIMLYSRLQYSKLRRDAYYKCKVQETKDYSDLQDRINLIEEAKGRDVVARPKQGGSNAGAHVALGLGAGGRGGLASTIIRGR